VGNGTRLAIKNTGIFKLSPNFILRSVLHVPQITKNLLYIKKFTYDNDVFMEFHPSLMSQIRSSLFALPVNMKKKVISFLFSLLTINQVPHLT
jgi:hypothetical protein